MGGATVALAGFDPDVQITRRARPPVHRQGVRPDDEKSNAGFGELA